MKYINIVYRIVMKQRIKYINKAMNAFKNANNFGLKIMIIKCVLMNVKISN